MLHFLQFHTEEMAEPRLRGTLSACIPLTYSIGVMLIYLIGFNISWKMSAGLGAGIALIDLMGYSLLHESPVWFVRKNRISDARKVFSWLWGSGHEVEVRHSSCIHLLNGRHNAGCYTVVHDLDCSTERRIPLPD
jgi:hypothetical protein